MNMKYACTPVLVVMLLCCSLADGADSAVDIVKSSGVAGGVIVHVGCGDGKLTAAFRVNDSYLVHGLDSDPARVKAAREHISAAGVCGKVSIAAFDGRKLPYAENSVNLVVIGDGFKISDEEILRVLTPGGTAVIDERKLSKPVPDNIDDWSHFLQGPENNPVAEDTVIGPPRRMQWVAGPRWLRSHEVPSGITSIVTAGGRIFYTLDEGPIGITDSRLPEKWSLVARDAFNGTLLWKMPLPKWGWQTFQEGWRDKFKSETGWIKALSFRTRFPGEYVQRMVADDQRLYFTLGNDAPVSIIDAAGGKVLADCLGSESAKKLLLSDGVLVVQTAKGVVAFDSRTGKSLWKIDGRVSSLAAQGARMAYHSGGKEIRCVDLKSGRPLWTSELAVAGPLVISNGTILSVSMPSMQTFSLETGKTIWTNKKGNPKRRRGGQHPGVYIVDDTIWVGYKGQRVDFKTGKKLPSLDVKDLWSPQHHHRCYSNKATSKYVIGAMEGLEFLALKGDEHSRNNWVRGSCRLGIVPGNGMTYVPTDQCYCSAGVKILGFSALIGARDLGQVAPPAKRLVKGAAFGKSGNLDSDVDERQAWPAFRHDSLRSGATGAEMPAEIKSAWQVKLPGSLTQPVAVDDTLWIASRDTHTLYALDAETGKQRWRFIAGGRIDSPPTIHHDLVLFGSADGNVYCLRAGDGELVWRFRAAPHERMIGSFDQLESAWPVHGSVLMLDGLAYVSAGRSTYLDGGIFLYAIEPKTGKVVHQHQEIGPYEDHTKGHGHSYWSEGARNDVLVSDGEYIYIMQLRFDRKLKPSLPKTISLLGDRRAGRHVFSTSGFLDDEWYNRTFWMNSNIWPGFYLANQASKSGQLLVVDKSTTYGVKTFWTRNRHSPMFFPATKGYLLVADDNDNEPILIGRDKGKAIEWLPEFNLSRGGNDKGRKFGPNLGGAPQLSEVNAYTYNKDKGVGYSRVKPPKWAVWVPIRVKAMVSAADKLFIAGAPDTFDDKDPLAALEGRAGGLLRAVSKSDGKKLAQYPLDAPPVLDGLITANGKLYIATRDGKLTCWRKK
ncbi:MAG: PQQ-binding-like beta-propeller repeat protein [Phycisphaerae bacterium]|jgi:outer membrane protein assembly factor BamB/SAM-dependent methyltransferase|nr:PQQ-binding-like beta-propeller repeat protein [Phycisphaerae bacterium]